MTKRSGDVWSCDATTVVGIDAFQTGLDGGGWWWLP